MGIKDNKNGNARFPLLGFFTLPLLIMSIAYAAVLIGLLIAL